MATAKARGSQTVTRARKGADGKGIQSQTDYYAVSSSATTAPISGWSTAVPAFTDTDKYLWKYTRTVYTDGSYSETTKSVVGVKGDNGLSYRYSRWSNASVEYRNDNNPFYRDSDGRGIVDIVYRDDITIWDPATDPNNPPDAFICRKTHTSGATTSAAQNIYPLPSSGQTNAAWSPVNSVAPILTALVLANKIKANAIDVGDLSANAAFITELVSQTAFINQLNTKNLRAKEITTENSGSGFLNMIGNVLQLFNSSGDERMKIHGGTLSSMSGSTITEPSSNQSATNSARITKSTTEGESIVTTTTIFTRTTAEDMVLKLPTVNFTAGLTYDSSSQSGNDVYVMMRAEWLVDDIVYSSNQQVLHAGPANTTDNQTITIYSNSLNLSAGSHTVKIRLTMLPFNPGQMDYNDELWASIMGGVTKNTISLATSIQKVEIASNGFRVALASNVYFTVYLSGGYNYIQMMNENYGLRITNTGIQKTTNGGSTWTSL